MPWIKFLFLSQYNPRQQVIPVNYRCSVYEKCFTYWDIVAMFDLDVGAGVRRWREYQ